MSRGRRKRCLKASHGNRDKDRDKDKDGLKEKCMLAQERERNRENRTVGAPSLSHIVGYGSWT